MREALALARSAIGAERARIRASAASSRRRRRTSSAAATPSEAGGAHAEVAALADARAAGHGALLRGATVHVTLEPCSHHGRTPPCCDALVEAGVARVVVAVRDPNPLVAGARLRAAARRRHRGRRCSMPLALAEASRELNIGFFSRMQRGLPWLRAKVAISLDGRSALADGQQPLDHRRGGARATATPGARAPARC